MTDPTKRDTDAGDPLRTALAEISAHCADRAGSHDGPDHGWIGRRCADALGTPASGTEASDPPADGIPGWKTVPEEPTEVMWAGLARAIVMWSRFSRPHGRALYQHLASSGEAIPDWLRREIPDTDHVPPKGTVAVCLYKAMLADAPSPPSSTVDDLWAKVHADNIRLLQGIAAALGLPDWTDVTVEAVRSRVAGVAGVAATSTATLAVADV